MAEIVKESEKELGSSVQLLLSNLGVGQNDTPVTPNTGTINPISIDGYVPANGDTPESGNILYSPITPPAGFDKKPLTSVTGAYKDYKAKLDAAHKTWQRQQEEANPNKDPATLNTSLADFLISSDGTELRDEGLPGTGQLDIIINRVSRELTALVTDLSLDNPQRGLILSQAIPAAINASIHYGLNENTSYWDSVTAQMRARKAEIEATASLTELNNAKNREETVRVQLASSKVDLLIKYNELLASNERVETEKHNKDAAMAQTHDNIIFPDWEVGSDGITPVLDGNGNRVQKKNASGNPLFCARPVEGTIGKNNAVVSEQAKAFKGDQLNKLATLFVNTYAVEKSNGEANVPDLLSASPTNAVMKALIEQTTGLFLFSKANSDGTTQYALFKTETQSGWTKVT